MNKIRRINICRFSSDKYIKGRQKKTHFRAFKNENRRFEVKGASERVRVDHGQHYCQIIIHRKLK